MHKDLKPANVLLKHQLSETVGQKRVVAKISDFGISRRVLPGQEDFVSAKLKGTIEYMDPLYLQKQVYTKASDVYSFGIILL